MTGTDCPSCGATARPGARFCRTCGTALTAPAPVQPTDTPAKPATTRRRWWRSRRLQVAVAVLTVVACGGWYALTAAIAAAHPPEDPVRDLFAALNDRDGQRLADLVDCRPARLCTAASLATGYTPPSEVTLLETTFGDPVAGDTTKRPDKNRATVKVRYRLPNGEHTETVQLARDRAGLVRRWHITTSPGAGLDVITTTPGTARAAGAAVDTVTAAPSREASLLLPPGTWTITADPTALLTTDPVKVHASGDRDRQSVRLTSRVRPDVLGPVQDQIRARIDACAAVDDLRPDVGTGLLSNCPFSATTRYTVVRNVRWEVRQYPEIELRQDDAGTVTVHTTRAGRAQVRYQYSREIVSPDTFNDVTDTVDITVGGQVDVAAGAATWSG